MSNLFEPDPLMDRVVTKCGAIRDLTASLAGYNLPCRTLRRFLGKIALLVESLDPPPTWPQAAKSALEDILEALSAVHDVMLEIAQMSRFQSLFYLEDSRERLRAAGADLQCVVAALDPLTPFLSSDSREDLALLQQQLNALRLETRAAAVSTADNMEALVTLISGNVLPHQAINPTLQAAFSHVGLPYAEQSPPPWIDAEIRLLAEGTLSALHKEDAEGSAEEDITGFLLHSLMWLVLIWTVSKESDPREIKRTCTCDGDIEQQWEEALPDWVVSRVHSGTGGDEQQPDRPPSPWPHNLCALQLGEATVQAVLEASEAAKRLRCCGHDLRFKDAPSLCAAMKSFSNSPSDPASSEVIIFKAAVFMAHACEGDDASSRSEELVNAGAVDAALAAVDACSSSRARAATINALRMLCRTPEGRKAAAISGWIYPLSRFVQSSKSAVRRASTRALGNLVLAGEGCRREAERLAVGHSLAAVLRGHDALAAEAAAGSIANLAANSDFAKLSLGRLDSIFPCLCDMLRSTDPEAQKSAARAVRNLASRNPPNCQRAVAAGAIPALIALIGENGGGTSMSTGASLALAALCEECPMAREEAMASEAFSLMFTLLCDREHPKSAEAAAIAMSHLPHDGLKCKRCHHAHSHATITSSGKQFDHSNGRENHSHIEKDRIHDTEGYVAALIAILKSNSASSAGQRASARVLEAMARGQPPACKEALGDTGAIDALVTTLSAPQDAVRRAAAAALCPLLHRCDANRRRLLAIDGALPSLINLLRRGTWKEERTRCECARALGALCANNSSEQGQKVAAAGAIPPLVALLRDGTPSAQEATATALSNLACVPSNQSMMLAAGAVPPLVRLLRQGGANGCRRAAAFALANLLADGLAHELRMAMWEMVPLLADMAADEADPLSQAAAAGALGNLACADEIGAEALATRGGAVALARLCRSPAPATREAGVQALWEACQGSVEARHIVAQEGVIPWLVELLKMGVPGVADAPTKEAAAGCLAQLARLGQSACDEAEQAGARSALEQLIKGTGCMEVINAAERAMRALNRCGGSPTPPEPMRRAVSRRWVDEVSSPGGSTDEVKSNN